MTTFEEWFSTEHGMDNLSAADKKWAELAWEYREAEVARLRELLRRVDRVVIFDHLPDGNQLQEDIEQALQTGADHSGTTNDRG